MCVCDELRDDSGFGENLTVVGKARDEAALLFLAPTTSIPPENGRHTGLTSRYQGSRGFRMSIITSS